MNNNSNNYHIPVLLKSVLENLPEKRNIVVDCTFGAGGYSRSILQANKNTIVYAIDRDEKAVEFADILKNEFGERFFFLSGLFSDIKNLLLNRNVATVDSIIFDLGVSSMQIDEPSRGFSFQKDGALDMQMGFNQVSAWDIVNKYKEKDLADLIYKFGDEKKSRVIARKIVEARQTKSIDTTLELSNIIKKSVLFYNDKIDPATRTFQAIRIITNNELEELKQVLNQSLALLNTGGRIICVSFHSLEDKIIKDFFNMHSGKKINPNRHELFTQDEATNRAELKIVNKKVIVPEVEEIKNNIRSRSAKMRVAEKL